MEDSCRGCSKCKIKEIHCKNCNVDLDIYYYIDDKCLCLDCAIKYVEDNIERFEEEYDIFENRKDVVDFLKTHFETRF